MNRKMPYGYQIQNGVIVTQSQEAAGVKRIFSLYLAGKSRDQIADALPCFLSVIFDFVEFRLHRFLHHAFLYFKFACRSNIIKVLLLLRVPTNCAILIYIYGVILTSKWR